MLSLNALPAETEPENAAPEQRRPMPFGARLLLAALVGLLFVGSFPPFRFAYLLPIGVAGLLVLLHGVTVRHAAYLGLAFGFVWFAGALWWLKNIFGGSSISLWAIGAVYPMLFCLLYVWTQRRLPRVPAWLAAATLWTAIEYLRSEVFDPRFGFLGLGYAVVNAPYVVSVASILGGYGVTFLIVALGGLLLTPAQRGVLGRLDSAPAAPLSAAFALRWLPILLAWEAAFFWRSPLPEPRNPVQVRLVQAPSEDEESLFQMSRTSLNPPGAILLLPEYSFVHDPRRNPKLWERLKQLARKTNAYLLFGAKDQFDPNDPDIFRNTAFLLNPQGELIAQHVKNHTIPFIRDGVAGKEAKAVSTSLGRLGVGICFDFDFPDVAQRLAADGAELFLVPSNNPMEWGAIERMQHFPLFQMRAIECRRWLATSDVAGNTAVFASNGQEYRRLPPNGDQPVPGAMVVPVGRETGATLFVRGGWRFGQLCLLGLILLVASSFVAPRRV